MTLHEMREKALAAKAEKKAEPKRLNNVLHFTLSVVTGGLWLPVWLILAVQARR